MCDSGLNADYTLTFCPCVFSGVCKRIVLTIVSLPFDVTQIKINRRERDEYFCGLCGYCRTHGRRYRFIRCVPAPVTGRSTPK